VRWRWLLHTRAQELLGLPAAQRRGRARQFEADRPTYVDIAAAMVQAQGLRNRLRPVAAGAAAAGVLCMHGRCGCMNAVALCRFDLAKAERRQHLVEGFLSALARMDAVVAAIRAAPDGAAAARALCTNFQLSPEQARAAHACGRCSDNPATILQMVLGLREATGASRPVRGADASAQVARLCGALAGRVRACLAPGHVSSGCAEVGRAGRRRQTRCWAWRCAA